MDITLGNFTYWRIRKFLLFLVCMLCSMIVMFAFDNDNLNTLILLCGLIIYGCLILAKRKYIFDSVLLEENKSLANRDIMQLKEIFEGKKKT